MKLRRNNHFLPVCYQKGFTDSQGLVWVKFAKKTEPEHRNPLSVGKVRDLYIRARNGVKDDQIEDFFQKSVESPFSALSHRIKEEREKLSEISGKEIGALARFVASQMFRTIAYKQCLDAQAGRALEARDFHRNMLRQMWTLMNMWIKSLPQVRFFTTLPYIGERFITGDNPVLVVYMKDNPIWEPTVTPQKGITNLNEVLNNPNHVFQVSLRTFFGFGNGESLDSEVRRGIKARSAQQSAR